MLLPRVSGVKGELVQPASRVPGSRSGRETPGSAWIYERKHAHCGGWPKQTLPVYSQKPGWPPMSVQAAPTDDQLRPGMPQGPQGGPVSGTGAGDPKSRSGTSEAAAIGQLWNWGSEGAAAAAGRATRTSAAIESRTATRFRFIGWGLLSYSEGCGCARRMSRKDFRPSISSAGASPFRRAPEHCFSLSGSRDSEELGVAAGRPGDEDEEEDVREEPEAPPRDPAGPRGLGPPEGADRGRRHVGLQVRLDLLRQPLFLRVGPEVCPGVGRAGFSISNPKP